MKDKVIAYATLLRVHKPIGSFLLLWPTLMALWIAGQGHPDPKIVFIFVMGVWIMRSAGCAINDLVDQSFDGHVERTKTRPLVLKTLTSTEAFLIFGLLITIAFGLVLQLNVMTRWLSVIALMLAMIYPLMKRVTHFPQVVLGAAYGFSIPMVFTAIQHTIPAEAWILYLATFCWVVAFDTEYAMVDKKDDLTIGVKSTAIFFGQRVSFIVFILQCLALGLFSLLGWRLGFTRYYYLGISVGLLTVIYQWVLIFNHNPNRCFKAFLNNNILGASLFFGLVVDYLKSLNLTLVL